MKIFSAINGNFITKNGNFMSKNGNFLPEKTVTFGQR